MKVLVEFQRPSIKWPIKLTFRKWKRECIEYSKKGELIQAVKAIKFGKPCTLKEAKEIFDTKYRDKYFVSAPMDMSWLEEIRKKRKTWV